MSALAKKYRSEPIVSDESELIGDPASVQEMNHFQRSSRFPANWSEAIQQLGTAVEFAALEGQSRIRVDLNNPELISKSKASSVPNTIETLPPTQSTRRKRILERMSLIMQATNEMLRTVLDSRDSLPGLGGAAKKKLGPPRGSIFFNSRADLELGSSMLAPDLVKSVEMYALGEGKEAAASRSDISVVLCPTNTQGNPSHIESMQSVHYSNWDNHSVVIVVNPALIALTRHRSLGEEPRSPSFLSDYVSTYYIDPVSYLARNAVGGVLRCYPRKWEMYLLKLRSAGGFRLIAEQSNRPSREKLLCEFSWRVDNATEI